MDAKLRLEMRSEIRRICKSSGLTAVYVTHDQNEALSIADRMVVLNKGHIQQLGTPEDIYRHPANRFVAEFIGESNFIDGEITAIENGLIVTKTAIGTIVISQQTDQDFKLNQKVTLSIRPEVIRLGDAPSNAHNVFSGSVHDTLYLGEMAQQQVKLTTSDNAETAINFKVFELNPHILARDQAQQASLWFVPEDVVVLVA